MRQGRWERIARLGGLAAGLMGDAAGAAAHLLTEKTVDAEGRLHRHVAERMLRVFGEMKGLPLKAGQMLSYIDEILPPEHRKVYHELLGQLQTHTPPLDYVEVEEVFLEEYDGRTPLELFREFDPEPVAAASIGQVYRAILPDGREVAVKVQYPGVLQAIDHDLENVESLVSALAHVLPGTDISHLVEDVTSRLREECDYELEARNQRDFYYCWAGDEQIRVPKVLEELCRPRVLVTEFVHGTPWAEMLKTASPSEKCLAGQTIFRFVFQSLLRYGMFNGDPHPGNYLFHPGGRVTFLDFGCVQRYADEQTHAFLALRDAVLAGTHGRDLRTVVQQGFGLPPDLDEELLELFQAYLELSFEPVTAPQPYRFTPDYTRRLVQKGMEAKLLMTKKLLQRKNAHLFQTEQQGLAFLGRINFGLGSILTSLGTEADFRAMLTEANGNSPP